MILKSDQGRPLIFDFFEYFNMVDKDTMEGPNAKTTVIGTGPFKFVEWAPGDHMSFTRNTNYWGGGQPYVDAINVSLVRDEQSMAAQLEAGALDAIRQPGLPDYVRLSTSPGYTGILHPNSGAFYLMSLNVLSPPTDNKQVRQALNFAIDRQRFVETALYGLASAQDLPWGPGLGRRRCGKECSIHVRSGQGKVATRSGRSGKSGNGFESARHN